jgi:uncharacterized protein YjeT (DUF2065 family)
MLLSALGMVLLIEGLMPLAFPAGWRAAMQRMASLQDGQLRFMGLVATVAGLLLLAIAG